MQKRCFDVCLVFLISLFFFPPCFSVKKDTTKKKTEASIGETESSSGKTISAIQYKGPKKRIAVMDFEDKSGSSFGMIGSGMTEMLTTTLHNTGRFIIVERQAISDVLTEQDFGMTARVRQETASKIGNIIGAQIMIKGAITEFEQTQQNRGGGISFSGISLGASGAAAHVGVDIRMYDVETGVVLESHRSEAKAKSGGLNIGVLTHGIDFSGSDFHKTPLGKATREAIEDMVTFIIEKMESKPWQGRIIKVVDNTVYINAGQEVGISTGDKFVVYSQSEDLIDPETGLSLGSEKTKTGEIEVSSVESKFAKAIIVNGSGFKNNDIIEEKK